MDILNVNWYTNNKTRFLYRKVEKIKLIMGNQVSALSKERTKFGDVTEVRKISNIEQNGSETPPIGYKNLFFCIAESFDETKKFTSDYFVAYNNFF